MLKCCEDRATLPQCSKTIQIEAIVPKTFDGICDAPVDYVTCCTFGDFGGSSRKTLSFHSLILASSLRRSLVFATSFHGWSAHSWSLNNEYSSSPTLTGLPPYWTVISKYPITLHYFSYLRYQNFVTSRDAHCHSLAISIKPARSDS